MKFSKGSSRSQCITVLPSIVFILFLMEGVNCAINLTEYLQMPPLYELDDYDVCMKMYPERKATYCIVRVLIKPDNDSETWKYIEKYSKERKVTFQHDLVDRGVCINTCLKLLNNIESDKISNWHQDKFSNKSLNTLRPEYFPNTLKYRAKYSVLVNQCLNFKLKQNFNVTGYTEIESCVSNDDPAVFDSWDKAFLYIGGMLLIVTCMSTLYDYRLRPHDSTDHFQKRRIDNVNMMLLSFSLPRTWNILNAVKTDDVSKQFRYVQGIRFIGSVIVIFTHTFFANHITPVSNTNFVEELFGLHYVVSVEGVRCYFVLGAFLFAAQFLEYNKTAEIKSNLSNFLMGLSNRYVRLTPTFAFTLLLHATVLSKFGEGPVWKRFTDSERGMCRNTFWINLFYLNNYLKSDEPCAQQGWYLNAEFQLFTFGMIYLFLYLKRPKLMQFILAVIILSSYILVAMSTYLREFEGIVVIKLDSMRSFMWFDDNYQKNYIPTHMNYGNYFIGILGGMIYHKLRHSNVNMLQYRTFRLTYQMSAAILTVMMLITKIFYINDYDKPSVWMALFSTASRHLWAWGFVVILIGLAQTPDSTLKRFFEHPAFNSLGKLSYCIFLVHLFVLKVQPMNLRHVVILDWVAILSMFLTNLLLSIILALILCLFIEIPSIALFEHWKHNSLQRANNSAKRSD